MKIRISFELDMNDEQMASWANEYGLDTDEAPEDARSHLSEAVSEGVRYLYHVEQFTTVKNFHAV